MNKSILKYILLTIILILALPFPIYIYNNSKAVTASKYANEHRSGEFLDLNGTEIFYELKGKKENPTVVLIHGFGGSTYTWRKNISYLNDIGYQTLAIDLPPFGLSQKKVSTDVSQDAQAQLVNAILEKLEINKVSVIGHSYGGGVAMYFAQMYPSKVNKLVIVDGAYNDPKEITGSKKIITSISQVAKLPGFSEYTKSVFSLVTRKSAFEKFVKSAYYDPSKISREEIDGYTFFLTLKDWANGAIPLLTSKGSSQPLDFNRLNATLKDRVFLIWGRDDTIVPLKDSKEATYSDMDVVPTIKTGNALKAKLPYSNMNIIEKSGHLPMEEQSDQFNSILKLILQ